MQIDSPVIQQALKTAWHQQTASSSIDRWLQLAEQQNFQEQTEYLNRLAAIFGASWYFTRFVFYHGEKSLAIIDEAINTQFDITTISASLSVCQRKAGPEEQFEELRRLKNQLMLQILVRYLESDQELSIFEQALTQLATATLEMAMNIAGFTLSSSDYRLSVLGMGRMAGGEMTFGSDLDLVLVFEDYAENLRQDYTEKFRLLLRHIAIPTAMGVLYEIDMRLRPHGTSGALISTVNSFIEHHRHDRECWERQIMTRCSPVIDYHGIGANILERICPILYAQRNTSLLAQDIMEMRYRVEAELGSPHGKQLSIL